MRVYLGLYLTEDGRLNINSIQNSLYECHYSQTWVIMPVWVPVEVQLRLFEQLISSQRCKIFFFKWFCQICSSIQIYALYSETCDERPLLWETDLWWETTFAIIWPYISIHLHLWWKTIPHIRPLVVVLWVFSQHRFHSIGNYSTCSHVCQVVAFYASLYSKFSFLTMTDFVPSIFINNIDHYWHY